jgi:cyclase
MKIRKIGSRGVLFTFGVDDSPLPYSTSVYLINAENYIFLCDTHAGPISMEYIKKYINEFIGEKNIIVFNSHSDYDHIWGNCFFGKETIISHTKCRELIIEKGMEVLKELEIYKNGEVVLRLPDLTFDSKIIFEEDNIEFFYTPGHSIDSSSCFDKKDHVIFSGDLFEDPIPYLGYHKLDEYIKTVESLKQIDALIISAHSEIVDEKLINENLSYVKSVHSGEKLDFTDERSKGIHNFNMKNIMESK